MRDVPFADPDVDDVPAFLQDAVSEADIWSPPDPPADASVDTPVDPPAEAEPQPVPTNEPFLLPSAGSGIRRHRRRRRQRHVWSRNAGVVMLALAVLAATVTALVVKPWDGGKDDAAGKPEAAVVPATLASSAVLVQPDARGGAGSITLLVANPTGSGGHIVLIPPATMSEVPSFGLDGVGRALALGGPPLLQITLENLFGVGLPPAVIANDTEMLGFVQPAGPLDVQVPGRVEETDGRGAVNVLWEPGLVSLAPPDVPRFLSARGSGNDLARLARHQSFWTAFLARVARDPGSASALPPALASVVKPLSAGPVSYEILPVEALDAGAGGDEVYRVRQGDLDQLVAQLLPGTPLAERVRVQVLNGTGAIGAAQQVARRLAPTGARVVLSGNADSFAYPQTQIVFYDRAQQQAANRVRQALGTGKLVLSRQPLDVVDVTVVVGKDFNG